MSFDATSNAATDTALRAALERARVAAEAVCASVESLPMDNLSRALLMAKVKAAREAIAELEWRP